MLDDELLCYIITSHIIGREVDRKIGGNLAECVCAFYKPVAQDRPGTPGCHQRVSFTGQPGYLPTPDWRRLERVRRILANRRAGKKHRDARCNLSNP